MGISLVVEGVPKGYWVSLQVAQDACDDMNSVWWMKKCFIILLQNQRTALTHINELLNGIHVDDAAFIETTWPPHSVVDETESETHRYSDGYTKFVFKGKRLLNE